MKKSLFLAALLATSLVAVQTRAALVTLSDSIDNAFDDATDLDPVAYQTSQPATAGVTYEVPVYFQISNLGAGQSGFGNIDITCSVTGPLTIDQSSGYSGNPAFYSGTKNYYFANTQAGVETTTTSEVVASIAAGVTSTSDKRYSMGKTTPFLIGDFYIDVPAGTNSGIGTISVVVNAQSTNNSGVLTLDTAGTDVNPSAISLNFNPVPEPASIGMLGVGALGLLARRRRTA
jgi:PEP-CTERM motif